MSNTVKKWVLLLLLSFIWGSSFILIKKGLLGFSPLQLGSFRLVISAHIIFAFGFKSLKGLNKNQWKWLALSGFLGSFFPSFLFAYAETEVDSTITSILNSLVPLNTVVLGFVLFKIKSNRFQVSGVVIGFIGAVLLILEGAALNPNQNYRYTGLIILASLMYAANVNIIKRYLNEVRPLSIATANFVVVFIPSIAVLIFSGGMSRTTLYSTAFLPALGCVFLLSLFGTALAKILFNNLIQISNPVFASSVTYLMPLVALFWGALDAEIFNALQGLSALIILSGIYLANKKIKKKTAV
ncbi:MAG: permease [Flavobacteriaceae bacterium]|nr:permease [Flavobacteriaceae bacterium]|tara:strand:- start:3681 stop:4574 length:894 start_codon:yes stop_codon:yes gene_type:complete